MADFGSFAPGDLASLADVLRQGESLVKPIIPPNVPLGVPGAGAKPAPATPAPVEAAPAPKLVPALRRGDEVLEGGLTHADVAVKHNYFPTSRDDEGFTIPGSGKLLSRQDALDYVKAQEPTVAPNLAKARMGRLESQDLNRARGDALPLDAIQSIIKQTTENGGHSINLAGATPTSGLMVGRFANEDPRTAVIEGPLTSAHVNDFVKKNLDVLKEPEHYLGTWRNPDNGKTYIDVSRRFEPNQLDDAMTFGRGTGQLSGYDVGAGKTFDITPAKPPTFVERMQVEHGYTPRPEELAKIKRFERQGMDPEQAITMLGETAPAPKKTKQDIIPFGPGIAPGDTRISTRFPHGPNMTADPLREHLKIGVDEMKQTPAFEHNANLIPNYPGFGSLAGLPPEQIAKQYVEQTSGNLQHLFNRLPKVLQDRAPRWYFGANRLVDAIAERHGIPRQSVAAAVAALSPQKDWFMNGSLGERAADVVFGPAGDRRATPEMFDWARTATSGSGKKAKPLFSNYDQVLIKGLKGKRFSDLTDPAEQAIWLRMYDEAHNPRSFREITPEGELGPIVTDANGNPKDIAWGSFNEIARAIQLLKSNGDMDKISSTLSPGHKTRSFYNDIELPGSLARFGGDPVIDTHAIGAGQLRSVSQKDPAVVHNFGSSLQREDQLNAPFSWAPHSNAGFKSHGVKGTYGFMADSYRDAGNALGLSPLQTQSPTWEGIRLRFPQEGKRGNMESFNPDNVWRAYERGELSLEQARNLIVPEGSIGTPSWAEPGYVSVDPRKASTYR